MNYFVFRKTNEGTLQQVGATRFKEVAMAIYNNWSAAYVAHGGDIIEQKGLDL